MATFYFNGAADLAAELPTDWQNLGNWWMNDGFTIPATSLPSSGDDVIVSVSLDTNSGSSPITINNLTVNAPPNVSSWFIRSTWDYAGSSPPITLSGVGIFNGPADYESYVCVDITGNCTFNNRWFFGNFDGRTLTGNATFNNNAQLASHANGNCTFNNNSACGWGGTIINGNVTLNDNSFISPQAINGDVVFNNFSYFSTFYGTTITGNVTLNDYAYNDASYATATLTDIINGTVTCNGNSRFAVAGPVTVNGFCTFNDSSSAASSSAGGTINGDFICIFNDSSYNNGTINGDCTFNDSSYAIGYYSIINGDCIFNNNATMGFINNGTLTGVGTVNGNCTFSLSSAALHIDAGLAQIKGSDTITGNIDFNYEKGINGSSILGIL